MSETATNTTEPATTIDDLIGQTVEYTHDLAAWAGKADLTIRDGEAVLKAIGVLKQFQLRLKRIKNSMERAELDAELKRSRGKG